MLASTEFTLILSMRLNTTKGKRLEGGKAERRDEDQSSGRPVGLSARLCACKPVRLQACETASLLYIFITHNESLPVCSLSA